MISIKPISSKQTWPVRHKVLFPKKEYIEVKQLDDSKGLHFGLYDNDELVSVASWFQSGNSAHFRKFGTIEEKQGLGFGTKLLQHLIDFSRARGVRSLKGNVSVSDTKFFKKFGFLPTDTLFQQDDKMFLELELILK